MSTLAWNDSYALNQPRMDDTHREFVDLLAAFEAAIDAGGESLGARFAKLLAHTETHFAQEDRWMAAVGFAAENCHGMQHAQLLHALRQVPPLLPQPNGPELARTLVRELSGWFPTHALMMDAVLAEVMVVRGFDPASETFAHAAPADATLVTGCGSERCA